MTTDTIGKFFNTASPAQFRSLMAVLDKMQDAEDKKAGKHIPIQLTAAIMAEAIHQSEVMIQKRAMA